MLLRVLRLFLRPYRGAVAVVVLLQAAATIAALSLPSLNADIIDLGVVTGDTGYILRTGALMLGITAVQIAASIVAVYIGARTAMSVGRDLRSALFDRVQQFSLEEMGRFGAPSLITRTTNDVQQVQMVTLLTFTIMVMAPIMMVGGVVMALRQDVVLSGLLVVIVPVLILVMGLAVWRMRPLFRQMQGRLDRINRVLREQIAGVRVVRSFNRQATERQRFEGANTELMTTALSVGRLMAMLFPAVMLIINVSSVAVIWFGAGRIDAGDMQVGSLVAFLNYLMQILMSVLMAVMMFMMVPRAEVAAERIRAVLATEPAIVAPAAPTPLPRGGMAGAAVTAAGNGRRRPGNIATQATVSGNGQRREPDVATEVAVSGNGQRREPDVATEVAVSGNGRRRTPGDRGLVVELDGATFGYAGAEMPVVRGVDLRLEPGRTTAIIGSTGAGKTTLVNLIPRLIDVTAGAVRVGGVDVRAVDPGELRERICLVPQKSYLFSGTIASTLRHGRPGATDDDLWRAIDAAQARDFVDELADGLATPVEQGGTNFSGGQRQRLAIARALLRQGDVYLFDDSFSALDYATDARLRAALPAATGGATVLIVAQRVASIRDAHQIVVLDGGAVVGTGTHHELMETNETYREIVLSQLSAAEAA
ncbi:ABC transporter ATP-binding protein [Georgenia yuyongxinii]|uniref:ABC transporter ATP-binding protein n=1 Tax=Georgenia yuyongxinii TaxID=2589797 RepID=A0A552WNT4_9MICO|nr:ABC transporter ATP-binding protein [Georgenia yuyongxinii]TRW44354.1 ABC transporter ATP-binding protein [Georgenia yuyongxinii]